MLVFTSTSFETGSAIDVKNAPFLIVASVLLSYCIQLLFCCIFCDSRQLSSYNPWREAWRRCLGKVELFFAHVTEHTCPKRRARYFRCARRAERRRRQKESRGESIEDNASPPPTAATDTDNSCCCPFSRAALFYKLHLPPPLPLCDKKKQRLLSSCAGEEKKEEPLEEPVASSVVTEGRQSACLNPEVCTSTGEECPSCSNKECKPSKVEMTVPRRIVVEQYQTPLIDLARMQQWKLILQRGVNRREAKYRDVDGLFPLHWASSGGPPVEVIQALLDAYPSAVKKVDKEGSTPLHFATHYSASIPVIEALLNAYPKAASKRDKYGRSPLFHAVEKSSCIRVWRLLIEADPSMILQPCLPPKSSQNIVINRAAAVRTPLFLAWISVIKNRRVRMTCQGRYFEKAQYLLEAAWSHLHPPQATLPTKFRFLPVAISMDLYLPEQVIPIAIQANPEQLGEQDEITPLSLAASMNHYSPERGHALIKLLLQAYPPAARIRDYQGRSSLVHALASGMVWNSGVKELFEADPGALQSLDRRSSLSPALIAASTSVSVDNEDSDDASVASQNATALRECMDPFHLLTPKDHDRIDAYCAGSSSSGSNNNKAQQQRQEGATSLNTVYELVRADPAAALGPFSPISATAA